MNLCMLRHALIVVEDPDFRPLLELAAANTRRNLVALERMFQQEDMPIPCGFGDHDVNQSAKRLFSDVYFIRYLKHCTRVGMGSYAIAKALSARADIRRLFTQFMVQASDLLDKVVDVQLEKGVYIRPPVIPKPEKVEFIERQSFFSGLLGPHRPLTAIEITHIGMNIELNSIGQTMVIGFSQTAQLRDVRSYMWEGKSLAGMIAGKLEELLNESDIPAPHVWDSTVSDSTEAPFSDRLMMFMIKTLNAAGIADYGTAIGSNLRKDVAATYARFLTEVGKYALDGIQLMVEQAWLEQPPQAIDRTALSHR